METEVAHKVKWDMIHDESPLADGPPPRQGKGRNGTLAEYSLEELIARWEEFYAEQGLDPLPASTGVEAKLCRPELLVEIEAVAIFPKRPETEPRP